MPPGQYVTYAFPVLSAGPTPHTPLEQWSFELRGSVDEPVSWTWDELTALPAETVTVDIHCVTKLSKLDTSWTGVSLDTLLEGVDTPAEYALAFRDAHTTVTQDRAWAYGHLARGGGWVAGGWCGGDACEQDVKQATAATIR